jgi:hypothetical protein
MLVCGNENSLAYGSVVSFGAKEAMQEDDWRVTYSWVVFALVGDVEVVAKLNGFFDSYALE